MAYSEIIDNSFWKQLARISSSGARISLIFDLDDTLVPSSLIYKKSLKRLLSKPQNREYLTARKEVKSTLGYQHPSSRNRLLYFKRMYERQNQFNPNKILKLMSSYERIINKSFSRQWKLLKREKLFRALSKQFDLYLITNENLRTQLIKLNSMDPKGQIFKGILTSEEAGFEKPHGRIFKSAFDRYKINPHRSIMIGNDWKCDISPAVKLGSLAIWTHEFATSKEKVFKTKNSSVHTTRDLNSALNTLLEKHKS